MRARGLVAVVVEVAVATAVVVGIGAFPTTARAQPRLEAGGFVGVDWFGVHTELGNSWAAEQVPGTSAVVGGRLGWLARPELPGGLGLALAIEGELAVAPAFTGASAGRGRMKYFAPVLEWRGQAVLRLARWRAIAPHLVLGAGGDSVASRSPFMAADTDPIAYWGPGLGAPIAGGWQLRVDLRHGVMPARTGGVTSTVELELGVGTTFGAATARRPGLPSPAAAAPPPVPGIAAADAADRDGDGDGVPDRLDACPDQPGTPSAPAGAGCPEPEPEPDPDGDGIVGPADRCPDQPEDRDGWQDEDGCPDPDNDGDGIADAQDACPDAPETVNGWQDEDGCPDELPGELTAALATTVRFEPGHARVTPAAGAALRGLREALEHHPELRIAIIGRPERRGGDDLARRRSEAVKWHLVDDGIAEDRIVTRVVAAAPAPARAPVLVFELLPAGPVAAAPP